MGLKIIFGYTIVCGECRDSIEFSEYFPIEWYTDIVYNYPMNDIYDVKLTVKAKKDLKKIPLPIALKLQSWIEAVGHNGLSEVRKIPGYHDESLKGQRKGQRSIRLNIAYRAIYTINKAGVISFVEIQEVNKHEY